MKKLLILFILMMTPLLAKAVILEADDLELPEQKIRKSNSCARKQAERTETAAVKKQEESVVVGEDSIELLDALETPKPAKTDQKFSKLREKTRVAEKKEAKVRSSAPRAQPKIAKETEKKPSPEPQQTKPSKRVAKQEAPKVAPAPKEQEIAKPEPQKAPRKRPVRVRSEQ